MNTHEGWNQLRNIFKNVEQRFRAKAVTRPRCADLKLAVMKTHTVLAVAMAVK